MAAGYAEARSLPDKQALPIYDASASQAALETLMAAAQKAQAEDCQGAIDILEGLRKTAGFAALGRDKQGAALDLGTSCALQRDQDDVAYGFASAGAKLAHPSALSLRVSLWQLMRDHQPVPALGLIEALATLHKDDFNDTPISWFYNIERDLSAAHKTAEQARLYAIVVDRGYAPSEPGMTIDHFRYEYAAVLAARGDTAKAGAVFAKIDNALDRIHASLDLRLRKVVPAGFDARAAVEQDLARLQKQFAAHPDNLRTAIDISRRLRWLGRGQDSLAVLERNRPDGPNASRFTDLKDQAGNWWDFLSETYAFLGRYDDAVAALRKGAAIHEEGAVNVNQTLDLAELQMTHGHDADALTTLAGFKAGPGMTSDFGTMVFTFDRGCARFRTGDLAGAKADRDYALAHERDLPQNAQALLQCMGDLDGAAAVLIRQLDDPDLRVDALLDLSDYDDPPFPNPADPGVAALPQLKARADVSAAIARAGGIRRFRLQRGI